MAEDAAVLTWAREVDRRCSLGWGLIEAEVLAHEPVASRTPAWAYLLSAIGWIGATTLLIPIAGSPVIGLGLLLVALDRPESDAVGGLLQGATVAFSLVLVLLLAAVRAWWVEGRRRNLLFAGFAALALICAGIAFGIALTTTDDVGLSTVLVVTALSITAAVVTLGVTASSRSKAPSKRPPRRGPRNDRSRRRFMDTREQVLDILLQRGVVHLDDADRKRMIEMPLGYWEELDGADDAQRRRILELRTVGWRRFTDDDRRAWPPAPPRDRR